MSFKIRKLSLRKKGVLGGFISTFVATLIIVFVLLLFVLGASFLKKIGGGDSVVENKISDKDSDFGKDFNTYSEYFSKFHQKRFLSDSNKKITWVVG